MARSTSKRKKRIGKKRERGFSFSPQAAKSGGSRHVRRKGGEQKLSGGTSKGGRGIEPFMNIIKVKRPEPKVIGEKQVPVPKPEVPKQAPQLPQIFKVEGYSAEDLKGINRTAMQSSVHAEMTSKGGSQMVLRLYDGLYLRITGHAPPPTRGAKMRDENYIKAKKIVNTIVQQEAGKYRSRRR